MPGMLSSPSARSSRVIVSSGTRGAFTRTPTRPPPHHTPAAPAWLGGAGLKDRLQVRPLVARLLDVAVAGPAIVVADVRELHEIFDDDRFPVDPDAEHLHIGRIERSLVALPCAECIAQGMERRVAARLGVAVGDCGIGPGGLCRAERADIGGRCPAMVPRATRVG